METPASQTRYQEHERALAYDRLSRHPETQPEAIAQHYLSNAAFAQDLYELVKARRFGNQSEEADKAIAYLTQRMKDEHARAFGLPLEWPRRD